MLSFRFTTRYGQANINRQKWLWLPTGSATIDCLIERDLLLLPTSAKLKEARRRGVITVNLGFAPRPDATGCFGYIYKRVFWGLEKKHTKRVSFLRKLKNMNQNAAEVIESSKRCVIFLNLAARCGQQLNLPIGSHSPIYGRLWLNSRNPRQTFLRDSVHVGNQTGHWNRKARRSRSLSLFAYHDSLPEFLGLGENHPLQHLESLFHSRAKSRFIPSTFRGSALKITSSGLPGPRGSNSPGCFATWQHCSSSSSSL